MKKLTSINLFSKKVLGSRANQIATKDGFFKKPIKPKPTHTNRLGLKK